MSIVHVSIDIAAPPEVVFDTIMDPRRLRDWVTIHRSVSNVSIHPDNPGAKMDQVLCMRGVNFKVHWTLVDVRRPQEAEWEGRGPALSKARIHYRLSGDSNGGTKFDYTNEFHAPGGPLGAVASRVFVGQASEREAMNSLNRLKALIESR
ncbi:MAG TPA: SRPBCC family protein [Solirubrobacteraceae bacterium]|nr:SRPBCC family protein [Solirubrobacteraceae bacterium]